MNALHRWSLQWKLPFNACKCKVLTIARSRNPVIYDYTICGTELERVREYVDFGVVTVTPKSILVGTVMLGIL